MRIPGFSELEDPGSFELLMQQSTVGPIPPPAMLGGYEQVQAGMADRIVKLAEHQAAHRQTLETTKLSGEIAGQTRGTYCGLLAVLAALAVAAYVASLGYSTAAGFIASVDLAALAAVFVHGRRSRAEDLRQHQG